MAWSCPQQDIAFDSSATSFLRACIDLIFAFLVLFCAFVNLTTSSLVRLSGLHIPCPHCEPIQKRHITSVDKTSQRIFVVEDSSLSSSRAVKVSGNIDHRHSSSNEATVAAPVGMSPGETSEISMEFSTIGGDGEGGFMMQLRETAEEIREREQEAIDREEDVKDRELMEALQSERDTLAALYSELEQERNSSATAASEALAMISRLQEEKASVQLEARQFQRMVMEKAMYDQEAIEVLKEIIVKREEEKIALEEEIRVCRGRLDSVRMEERHQAERAGKEILMLEGTSAEGRALEKPEAVIDIESDENGASVRAVKEDQSKYLDRLNKTKSQLLTALLQEGVCEPTEESASFADEVNKLKAKLPVKAEAILEVDERDKAPSGVGTRRTDCENSLQDPPGSARRNPGKIPVRNEGRVDEAEFVSLKRRWSSRSSQEVSLEALDKVKEERRIEEKRLSVLEYVWKFEEQLQQQGGRPPIQVTRPKSAGDSRSKTQSPAERSSISMTARKENSSLTGLQRENSLRRRLFDEGDSSEQDLDETSFQDAMDSRIYENQPISPVANDDKVDGDDDAIRVNNEKIEENVDDTVFVHDVYEVQNAPNEAPGLGMGEPGKLQDTSVVDMHQPDSDRLGKPDFLDLEEEDLHVKDEQNNQATTLPQEAEIETQQWEDLEGRVRYKGLRISTSLRRANSRTLVEEEVEQLTHRLKALEADRFMMKQTIESLRRENGEMKLLQEIAQQLRELRGMEQKELSLKDCLPLPLQFQAGPSVSKKRRYNSTPSGSSCRFGTASSALSQMPSRTLFDSGMQGGNFTFHGIVS